MSESTNGTSLKRRRRPTLAVTMGDPAGIGPEILLRAAGDERVVEAARIVAIGDEALLRRHARELKLRWPFATVDHSLPAAGRSCKPHLLTQDNCGDSIHSGQLSAAAGTAAAEAVEQAIEVALEGAVDGVVNGPIHKESLSLAGVADPGHTDLVARLAGVTRYGTFLWTESYAAALLSAHVAIRDALKKIRRRRILDHLMLFGDYWRAVQGREPRIAVAALNPHGGEGSRLGTEEAREIRPAIEAARERGLLISGPIPADSVFLQAREGRFDMVLALYHDQAAIPVKLTSGRRAVAVTAGLPFVRTSVEHGPAMDLAGRGVASPTSMIEAILIAASHVEAQSVEGTFEEAAAANGDTVREPSARGEASRG